MEKIEPVQRPKLTIIGISGYIGAHVCLAFLKHDRFKIRGTVRDTSSLSKVLPLREAYGELFDQLELVEANLLDPESIAAAVEGSTYVVHVASPVPLYSVKNVNKDIIEPAVEGTKAVLEACKRHRVKKLVITGSAYSIMTTYEKKKIYDENDFLDETRAQHPYGKSKIIGEKLAWDFHAQLSPEEKYYRFFVYLAVLVLAGEVTVASSKANFLGVPLALASWESHC